MSLLARAGAHSESAPGIEKLISLNFDPRSQRSRRFSGHIHGANYPLTTWYMVYMYYVDVDICTRYARGVLDLIIAGDRSRDKR